MQLFSDLYFLVYKRSRQRFSVNKGVLRNFAKFTGKHHEFIKKRLWHRCLPVYFAKFLRTSFLKNTSEGLLLCIRTESTIPFLYGKIWITENSYSGMFQSVLVKISKPERTVSWWITLQLFWKISENPLKNTCDVSLDFESASKVPVSKGTILKSHQTCSIKKAVLKKFRKFRKIFNKKETLTQAFLCEFCEIIKNTFLQNTSERLILNIIIYIK